ncbi:hypothetical protein J2X31_002165 [Flavobacterium arsenatis]|uniref:Uncharacterized protein n=1 Tax=Flavobacterium arsenatis TaxID=1484332 RepID=A0ABU1TQA3_9FLAO|nr:hypothetical protein [Flavobacterium arsenatis]MDR6968150.1 hypothetical protein [Flavobacterium arsenatis]
MRSFINWNILQRIQNSPKEFIVQRNVALLDAFLLGYEDLLLQLENEQQLKENYGNILSLEEYARKKYKAENIGSRNFKSIISFTCEDDLDFFHKYFDFLKEYEQAYPIQEVITYKLREPRKNITKQLTKFDYSFASLPNRSNELKEWIKGMRKRYPMYFGHYDISYFRAFLDGYFLCKKEYNLPFTTFDTKIKSFTESIICEDLNITGEFITWDRKYRYKTDWNSWGKISETTAKEILENLWKDLEIFTGEKLE